MDEEASPRSTITSLDDLSIHELEERLIRLQAEEQEIRQLLDKKKQSLLQASSFFKSK